MTATASMLKRLQHDVTFMQPLNPALVMEVVDDLQTTRKLVEEALELLHTDHNLQFNEVAKQAVCKLQEALQ